VKAAPPTRAVTLAPGKYACEMALVNEAAMQYHGLEAAD
jgi:hypothetical protein